MILRGFLADPSGTDPHRHDDVGRAKAFDGAREPSASFLDRLVTKGDLTTFCAPVVPVMLTTATAPSVIALAQQVGSRPSLIPILVILLLPLLWLALWAAREVHLWRRPLAFARRLRAVRAVVGERVVTEILDQLRREWPGRPDHLVTYRAVLYEYWLRRLRLYRAAWRARHDRPA